MKTPAHTPLEEAELLEQLNTLVKLKGGFLAARSDILAVLKQACADIKAHGLQVLIDTNDGMQCCLALSSGQDQLLKVICNFVAADTAGGWPKGLSLCATGGYGREELAPKSDLDLLFLTTKDKVQDSELIEKILYLLWDCGLQVGHAVRSHKISLQLAKTEHTIATAMMDLRFLFGDDGLCVKLTHSLKRQNNTKSNRQFVSDKLRERDIRHRRIGPTRYLVEPNIKEGKGGLRDLQTLVWIAQRLEPKAKISGGTDLTFFRAAEYRKFVKIGRFLWTIRCWLHFISDRAEDRLSFDLQPELARKLSYRDTTKKPAVERLMKSYFLNAKEVGFLTRIFCAKLEEKAAKPAPFAIGDVFSKTEKTTSKAGFEIVNGRLNFSDTKPLVSQPEVFIELFLIADRDEIHIHPDALAHIRTEARGIDRSARRNSKTSTSLLKCLTKSRDPEGLLRLMGETGLLGKLIPEYGRIIGQTQFNMYHSYTVDEHTYRAIGILRELEVGEMQVVGLDVAEVLNKTDNKEVLYLAMLLHDTGKGLGDQELQGGIVTRKVCTRLGLTSSQTELAGWLVENHLLFSDTAQGRDLGDPETIVKFTNKVGSLERLRLLFALTIADISAVGDGVWTEWKGQLLVALYLQTEQLFLGRTGLPADRELKSDLAKRTKEELRKSINDNEFWNYWLTEPSTNYWLSFAKGQLLGHARLIRNIRKNNLSTAYKIAPSKQSGLTEMVIWSADKPGLFAALCAITTANGANIASARVFTTKGGSAFDVFDLHDGRGGAFGANNPRAIARLETMLSDYFDNGKLPEYSLRKPTRRVSAFSVMSEVVVDNETSARATLIECVGADTNGLLRDLAQTLNQCRVNIHSAHISTYGERAVDIFYVNEKNGQKISNARRISFIRQKLMDVLEQSSQEKREKNVQQAKASIYR
ncbi:MAG: [protein-PII] uridylyltransferase [Robiginitomaculum sp.]|nr:[protein-PII] uridylyltransferase [Robiginitomaculum sp.]